VRDALQEAAAALGAKSRDVIAVLPDAACRLALLDFDALPSRHEEADAVIRFRLKKSLPFDIDRAGVSWQAQQLSEKLTVVAAVIPGPILEEYESVLRQAGLSPGVVLPSMLAALGQVDATIPTLVVKVAPATTSIAIADQDALLLIRTLDHPAGWEPNGAQLAEDVYPSLVFYQDTYGRPVEKILVSGLESLEQLNSALAEFAGMRAQELVSSGRVGGAVGTERSLLGAVAGALA
jgi:type IV pilus assembly protein PilM